ncbi:hypothetical protein U1Q18_018510, partial [Sarracenia purpurea var. burkii]
GQIWFANKQIKSFVQYPNQIKKSNKPEANGFSVFEEILCVQRRTDSNRRNPVFEEILCVRRQTRGKSNKKSSVFEDEHIRHRQTNRSATQGQTAVATT